jgi:hypothetical protein
MSYLRKTLPHDWTEGPFLSKPVALYTNVAKSEHLGLVDFFRLASTVDQQLGRSSTRCPCDDPWPKEQIARFKRWIDEGMAP